MALSEPVRIREGEEPKEATEEEVAVREEVGRARLERLTEEEVLVCAGVMGALVLAPPRRARSVERQVFSSGWTLGFTPAFPVGGLGLESCF